MTYTVAPNSPKAEAAAAFGLELAKACRTRDVSLKELERVLGVGHTTLWHYRHGRTLPRIEAAAALAGALDWPRLRTLVEKARTRTCRRPGCGRRFINDIGSEARKYCSPTCGAIVVNQRQAEKRARSAGQTDSHQARRAHVQRLRAAVKLADERVTVRQTAIDAMCAECEPEGLCRTAECPLRVFSPLLLERHAAERQVRTVAAIRHEIGQRPEVRAGRSAKMRAHHADPEYAARHSASLRAAAARRSPEQRETAIAKAKSSYPPERRAETSRRVHAARRAS